MAEGGRPGCVVVQAALCRVIGNSRNALCTSQFSQVGNPVLFLQIHVLQIHVYFRCKPLVVIVNLNSFIS